MIDTVSLERQLRARWAARLGIRSVSVRPINGFWSVLVSGPGPVAPDFIPGHVSVETGKRNPQRLPVFWRTVQSASPRHLPASVRPQDSQPANDLMWAGAPPVIERPVDLLDVRTPHVVGTEKSVPRPKLDEYQLFLPAHTPELPFWSEPFDNEQCACINAYNVTVPIWSFTIPATKQLTLRGISYTGVNIPNGSYVRLYVNRAGDNMATWIDMMANAAGNPSNQFAFGSAISPMPLDFVADHDLNVSVSARLLGFPPFDIQAGYSVDAQMCVELSGWISKNNDARYGWPRPQDLGDMNDEAQGYVDVLEGFKDAALVAGVELVLREGLFETTHPERGGLR